MLEEAADVMRKLWRGDLDDHRGPHYTVAGARLYSRPDEPPPVAVAMGGPKSARVAGRIGDAVAGVAPDADLLRAARDAAGEFAPAYGCDKRSAAANLSAFD